MLNQQYLAATLVDAVLCGRNLTDVLAEVFEQNPDLEPSDRGAIQDLSFGTLRHLGLLEAVLKQLASQKPSPNIEIVLLVALYQLEFGKSAPYAVVDHAVDLAGQLTQGKAGGFVNACLRRFQRERESLLEHARRSTEGQWSHPRWWVEQLKTSWPNHWENVLKTGNSHPPMTLRVNIRHCTGKDYIARLNELGIEGDLLDEQAIQLKKPVGVTSLPGFSLGHVSIQDWGAQLAAKLLDAQDGQRVLDACAAPGGKTGHILELADVDLLALDNDTQRLLRVKDNLQRLNFIAQTRTGDAGRPRKWWDGQLFDRILADVPCSASGVVRRHPDIKWLRRPKDSENFAQQQASILDALWQCLAPGGRMLYATCSIFPVENSEQIAAFLTRTADAYQHKIEFNGMIDGQLLPNDQHDGFYYAVLEKRIL